MGKEYLRDTTVIGEVPSLGPVVLYDNMEDLFKWVEEGIMGDSVFEKDITEAYNGNACLHEKSRTTGASVGDIIEAKRIIYQRPGRRYRFECIWKVVDFACCDMLGFNVISRDGATETQMHLWYDPSLETWRYSNPAGAIVDIPNSHQILSENRWHRVLVEWDEANAKYIKMISDSMEVDMSALGLRMPPDLTALVSWVWLYLRTVGAAPVEGYFDDVLLLEI